MKFKLSLEDYNFFKVISIAVLAVTLLVGFMILCLEVSPWFFVALPIISALYLLFANNGWIQIKEEMED
jgi:threonine/homoserine/homoserine lactone efflux protein